MMAVPAKETFKKINHFSLDTQPEDEFGNKATKDNSGKDVYKGFTHHTEILYD
jgi:hypothetical protein